MKSSKPNFLRLQEDLNLCFQRGFSKNLDISRKRGMGFARSWFSLKISIVLKTMRAAADSSPPRNVPFLQQYEVRPILDRWLVVGVRDLPVTLCIQVWSCSEGWIQLRDIRIYLAVTCWIASTAPIRLTVRYLTSLQQWTSTSSLSRRSSTATVVSWASHNLKWPSLSPLLR